MSSCAGMRRMLIALTVRTPPRGFRPIWRIGCGAIWKLIAFEFDNFCDIHSGTTDSSQVGWFGLKG